MPGPVATAIRNQRRPREPADAFSLALITTNNMGTPQMGTASTWSDYVDHHAYTACHDVAAMLADLLQAVPRAAPIATAVGAAAPPIGVNNFTPGHFLKVDYGLHSFTLINSAGTVECIEAWASGTAPYTVGKCLFDDGEVDRISIPQATAIAAFPGLLSPVQATRAQSANTLSRAGLPGFGNVAVIPTLRISAYPLAPLVEIGTRYRQRVDTAKEWARDAREHHRGRYTCSVCLDYHGWMASWANNTWGRCPANMCGRIYCPQCKVALAPLVFANLTHRVCTCGTTVNDIGWREIHP
ncbi:hypothetical protein [Pseudoduganella chitinolytica]|uniref:Uncharacterized protein n=1 Tax=Pseudoduganella chitinolytica TaxID=34070 RepID=A0ABY8BD37_9BURK|nr:hypothetical protein [Pseudoduganella chitinolytica]WEF33825.1 hypothetical protein PX653_03315 [Pseudoduganella chitinolytica]